MTDKLSQALRSKLMSQIRGKDTAPELRLRKAMWNLGLRYRLHQRIGRYRPDIIFPAKRLAVFVDGCFWHSCPIHGSRPKSNSEFWEAKFARNVERDKKTNEGLILAGWQVIRFWEHQIDESPGSCAQLIANFIKRPS